MLSGSPFLICRSPLPLTVFVTLGQSLNLYDPPFPYLKEIGVWHEVGGVAELGIRPEEGRLQVTCSVTPPFFSLWTRNMLKACRPQWSVSNPTMLGLQMAPCLAQLFLWALVLQLKPPCLHNKLLSPEPATQHHFFKKWYITTYFFNERNGIRWLLRFFSTLRDKVQI